LEIQVEISACGESEFPEVAVMQGFVLRW